MAAADKRLEIAFEAQFVDRRAISVELDRVNAGIARARTDPRAHPSVLPALERRLAAQRRTACPHDLVASICGNCRQGQRAKAN